MTETNGSRTAGGPKRHIRDMAWLRQRVEENLANGCWEWKLARNRHGYGHYGDNSGPKHKTSKAHRLAFELANGYLPDVVIHRCDNPPCCNPAHLQGGTRTENTEDMLVKHRNWKGKLSYEDAADIREALASGMTGRLLSQIYGVAECTISFIKCGQRWVHPENRTDGRPQRHCVICQQAIPIAATMKRIYCSRRCSSAAARQRRRVKIQST